MKILDYSDAGDAEERITALETKYRAMEAQVSTLLAELLDLKSVSMNMARDAGRFQGRIPAQDTGVQEPGSPETAERSAAGTAPAEKSVVIRPKGESPAPAPAAPAEPGMVRIMQSDGTFKMEVRRGDAGMTDSSGGWGPDRKTTSGRKTRNR
jgi:hypothetical protein